MSRVVVVAHHMLPHIGGVEQFVDLEIEALVAAGHSVTLVTSDTSGAGMDPSYPPTVTVVRLPVWNGLEERRQLAYPIPGPAWLRTLWRVAGPADVVHAHGAIFLSSVIAALVAALRRRPLLVTDHGGVRTHGGRITSWAVKAAFATLGRLTCRIAKRTVAQNERIATDLARLVPRGRPVTRAEPPPIDTAVFRPPEPGERESIREHLGWAADRPKVLFVGRLIDEKGVSLLLDAADEAYDLVLCGPGDPPARPDGPRFEYLPPRPQHDLAVLYRAADVVALPSTMREGGPLELPWTTREALLCGTPVVTSSVPEAVAGLPGLYVAEPTPSAVREQILTALRAGRGPGLDAPQRSLIGGERQAWLAAMYGWMLGPADGGP